MYKVSAEWNPKQRRLRESLSRHGNFEEAIRLCLALHSVVHASAISGETARSYMDEIWDGLSREVFSKPAENKNGFGRRATIAWNIWHITRIEDLTMNILVTDGNQVLDKNWLDQLGVAVTETGNAMDDAEILTFSASIVPGALMGYRNAVGIRTREIVKGLLPRDIGKKFGKEALDRILFEGGVTESEKSIWLLDFWGRKNVGGILLMPITRHQIVHLNECMQIKEKNGWQAHG